MKRATRASWTGVRAGALVAAASLSAASCASILGIDDPVARGDASVAGDGANDGPGDALQIIDASSDARGDATTSDAANPLPDATPSKDAEHDVRGAPDVIVLGDASSCGSTGCASGTYCDLSSMQCVPCVPPGHGCSGSSSDTPCCSPLGGVACDATGVCPGACRSSQPCPPQDTFGTSCDLTLGLCVQNIRQGDGCSTGACYSSGGIVETCNGSSCPGPGSGGDLGACPSEACAMEGDVFCNAMQRCVTCLPPQYPCDPNVTSQHQCCAGLFCLPVGGGHYCSP
jgi:hypothetical protein